MRKKGPDREGKRPIEQLLAHEEGTASQGLARELGIEPNALGARMTNLMRWAAAIGLRRQKLIVKDRRRDETGTFV